MYLGGLLASTKKTNALLGPGANTYRLNPSSRLNYLAPAVAKLVLGESEELAALLAGGTEAAVDASVPAAVAAGKPPGKMLPSPSKLAVKVAMGKLLGDVADLHACLAGEKAKACAVRYRAKNKNMNTRAADVRPEEPHRDCEPRAVCPAAPLCVFFFVVACFRAVNGHQTVVLRHAPRVFHRAHASPTRARPAFRARRARPPPRAPSAASTPGPPSRTCTSRGSCCYSAPTPRRSSSAW